MHKRRTKKKTKLGYFFFFKDIDNWIELYSLIIVSKDTLNKKKTYT
jgi:hypothetical protein